MNNSKNKMMQNCHSSTQKMTDENGQAKKQIEEAKTSNGATKMRAALEQDMRNTGQIGPGL